MKRVMIAVSLVMIPSSLLAQHQRIMSAREALESTLADFRGLKDQVLQSEAWPPFAPRTTAYSPVEETVSVASLLHRVPKAAKKAYTRAAQFSQKGDATRAAEELAKAIALYPEYAQAHDGLGVQYLRLGRLQEADAEARRAIALDPDVSIAHSNLGWVLFHSRNFAEAEQSARRALAISPNNDRAHGLLGILLAAAPATRAEGVRHLEVAVGTFPEVEPLLQELRER